MINAIHTVSDSFFHLLNMLPHIRNTIVIPNGTIILYFVISTQTIFTTNKRAPIAALNLI